MGKERAVLHCGKSGSAVHNEHEFKGAEKSVDVVMFCSGGTLKEAELSFYYEHYSEMLYSQNERYKTKGNYDRIKSMEEVYEAKRYKPTESILQYGSVKSDRVPTEAEFRQLVKDYSDWLNNWSSEHGNHLHVLNYSLHFDEGSPHAHMRSIWDYTDSDGIVKIGQEKAMERAGLEPPDVSKKVDRNNNRCITFTAMCRSKWHDILEAHGFEVEREPISQKRAHETVAEYQRRMDKEYASDVSDRLEQKEAKLIEVQETFEIWGEHLTAKEKELKQREKENEQREKELKQRENASDAREAHQNAREAAFKRKAIEDSKAVEKAITELSGASQAYQKASEDFSRQAFMKRLKYKDGSTAEDRYQKELVEVQRKLQQHEASVRQTARAVVRRQLDIDDDQYDA